MTWVAEISNVLVQHLEVVLLPVLPLLMVLEAVSHDSFSKSQQIMDITLLYCRNYLCNHNSILNIVT